MSGPSSDDGAHDVATRSAEPGRSVPTAAGALTFAATLTLGGVFGPWIRSGSSRRSSFEIIELVERLGFADQSAYAWTVRLWPVVPLVVVGAVVAAWSSRIRTAAALAGVAAVFVGGVAAGLTRAPQAALIGIEWGVAVSLAGALGMSASGIWLALAGRGARVIGARARARP